jgi:hypothetical protein
VTVISASNCACREHSARKIRERDDCHQFYERGPKKTRISKREKWDYFKTDNLPANMLKQIVDSLPDDVTSFYRIEVHNKLIFVFVPEIDLENKTFRLRQIDIFSPEGKYIYKARPNFGKNRVHLSSPLQNIVIKSGFLYAVLQDEEDNVLVAKYKISLPTL